MNRIRNGDSFLRIQVMNITILHKRDWETGLMSVEVTKMKTDSLFLSVRTCLSERNRFRNLSFFSRVWVRCYPLYLCLTLVWCCGRMTNLRFPLDNQISFYVWMHWLLDDRWFYFKDWFVLMIAFIMWGTGAYVKMTSEAGRKNANFRPTFLFKY